MRIARLLVLCIVFSGTSACSIMPYRSTWQCPGTDKGKCVTVAEAYEASVKGVSADDGKKDGKGKKKNKAGDNAKTPENIYRDNLQTELANLIKEPVTPVVVPPKIIRVLIFPYPEKKFLFMPRYVYAMVDGPEWVVGNYLIENGFEKGKTLTREKQE